MKAKKLLLWGVGIATTALIIDNIRIKKWITLPIVINNIRIPIPQGRVDFKFDISKINITGKPGQYQINFPILEIIDKKPSPHVIMTYQQPPIKLPEEIKSWISMIRIGWALRDIKIVVKENFLEINIPANIRVPIY
ncbi:MAG: hypothetical protein QME49_01650 [bacterium]|nr:hypothetical protein [bacterium]